MIYIFTRRPPQGPATDENLEEITVTPTPYPTPEIPVGWEYYSNTEHRISYAVPPNFEVEENGKNSILAVPIAEELGAVGTRFFYVLCQRDTRMERWIFTTTTARSFVNLFHQT